MHYEAPSVREIGPVRELTLQTMNKVGQAPDMFSQITQGLVVGSLINSP